jgi:hypothetical protein
MSRTPLPLHVGDLSALAKSLRAQLAESQAVPSHLSLLNMLARASGFRNVQHLKAEHEASLAGGRAGDAAGPTAAFLAEPTAAPLAEPAPAPADAPADLARLRKLIRHFDGEGRLIRWPGKFSLRLPCLWVMWSRLPAGRDMSEPEVNLCLHGQHLFGDPALLRRELFDNALVDRTPDGRKYRRLEKRPPAEALELIRQLAQAARDA